MNIRKIISTLSSVLLIVFLLGFVACVHSVTQTTGNIESTSEVLNVK